MYHLWYTFGNTGFCEPTEQSCEDNFDNDGDGLVDCLDSDCPACSSSEDCNTFGDEDGNGLSRLRMGVQPQ